MPSFVERPSVSRYQNPNLNLDQLHARPDYCLECGVRHRCTCPLTSKSPLGHAESRPDGLPYDWNCGQAEKIPLCLTGMLVIIMSAARHESICSYSRPTASRYLPCHRRSTAPTAVVQGMLVLQVSSTVTTCTESKLASASERCVRPTTRHAQTKTHRDYRIEVAR